MKTLESVPLSFEEVLEYIRSLHVILGKHKELYTDQEKKTVVYLTDCIQPIKYEEGVSLVEAIDALESVIIFEDGVVPFKQYMTEEGILKVEPGEELNEEKSKALNTWYNSLPNSILQVIQ